MNTNALKMLQQLRRVADDPIEDVSCHIRWLMNAMDEYIEKEDEEINNKKKRDARQRSKKKKFIPLPCADPEPNNNNNNNIRARDETPPRNGECKR